MNYDEKKYSVLFIILALLLHFYQISAQLLETLFEITLFTWSLKSL